RPAGGLDLAKAWSVTTFGVGLGAAGLLGLIVVLWAVAYRTGYNHGESDVVRDLRGPGAPVKDPLKGDQIAVNPGLIKPDPRTPRPVGEPPRPATLSGASAVQITPGEDPRQPGLNYFTIASKIDSESADRIAVFLTENG